MDIERFSRYRLLINTTARILKLYEKAKAKGRNFLMEITTKDVLKAEEFWVKDAQTLIRGDLRKDKYKKLCPRIKDNLIVVGGRTERWMEATWNKQEFILLPRGHRISELIVLYEHKESGHLAIASTVARIRSKYWIIGITKLVKGVISNCAPCVPCKKTFQRQASQIMSPLPMERLKPTPPFTNIGVGLFGPFHIKR